MTKHMLQSLVVGVRRHVRRTIVRSGRSVSTIEYTDEPGVFYIVILGRSRSGPFKLNDPRFVECDSEQS